MSSSLPAVIILTNVQVSRVWAVR